MARRVVEKPRAPSAAPSLAPATITRVGSGVAAAAAGTTKAATQHHALVTVIDPSPPVSPPPPRVRYVLTGGGAGVGKAAYSGCEVEFVDLNDKPHSTTNWCRMRLLTAPPGRRTSTKALAVGDEIKWSRNALRELLPSGELATKAPTREQLLHSAARSSSRSCCRSRAGRGCCRRCRQAPT